MIWFYYLVNHRSVDVVVDKEMEGDMCVWCVCMYKFLLFKVWIKCQFYLRSLNKLLFKGFLIQCKTHLLTFHQQHLLLF